MAAFETARDRSTYVEIPSQRDPRAPTSIERFVRADDPSSQNPLRRLVGRVCGVKQARVTELYLRREQAEDDNDRLVRNGRMPGYGSGEVVMPPGLGLDLDFDIQNGDRLARHLERGQLSR